MVPADARFCLTIMPSPTATDEVEARFEEDLERLEKGIRLLRAQYNRYFVGSADRPPRELQATLATIIHRQSAAGVSTSRRTADHFRFNSVVSNFHVLTEMWTRNVRAAEEGRGGTLRARRGTRPSAGTGEREIFRAHLSATDSNPRDERWQRLYSSYLQAAQEATGKAPSLSYQRFFERLHDRVCRYAEQTGQAELTCRIVVVDSRPILKLGSGT